MAEEAERLIAFALARLDEDEAAAKAAGGDGPDGQWHQDDAESAPGRIKAASGYVVTYDEGAPDNSQAVHIASHDPARVLREVGAKRAILKLHNRIHDCPVVVPAGFEYISTEHVDGDPHVTPCTTLRELASIWSDHPGYREAVGA